MTLTCFDKLVKIYLRVKVVKKTVLTVEKRDKNKMQG